MSNMIKSKLIICELCLFKNCHVLMQAEGEGLGWLQYTCTGERTLGDSALSFTG